MARRARATVAVEEADLPGPVTEDEDRAAPEEAPAAPSPEPAEPAQLTPMMAQFTEIKAANPDCLLFYRMGDFYELFFEDAVAASQALGITLTKRGKHQGEDIPMCGVPVHAADQYLQRLIRQGFRVAVCEQTEDPAEARKRGAKAVVRRDVIRLVTPGTLTEDTLLDATAHNYFSALTRARASATDRDAPFALASLDISTGDFVVGEVGTLDLPGEIIRLSPREILVPDSLLADPEIKRIADLAGAALTPVPGQHFDSLSGERDLKARLEVAELGGFGGFSRAELAAVGAALKYVDLTQIGKRPLLKPPRKSGPQSIMMIDAASRMSLEVMRTTSGERSGSLLHAVDRTVTAPGARELASRLSSPLRDADAIGRRLDAVGYLLDEAELRLAVRKTLRTVPDLARAMSRLSLGRGGPKDLAIVRDALAGGMACADLMRRGGGVMGLPAELADIVTRLDTSDVDVGAKLVAALEDDPPFLKRDGGFIRAGYSADLDRNRKLRDESRQVLAQLQLTYQDLTGNKALKVKHNNILGYFVEVTALQSKPLMQPPLSETFNHRQTMANAVRFTTAELVETEGAVMSAAETALALEQEIFASLTGDCLKAESRLTNLAAALAELDHHAGLAELAEEQSYARPTLDTSRGFEITGGRHPVVEQALKRAKSGPFIENDCVLGRAEQGSERPPGFDEPAGDARLWLVTGPNMAGKSTFLRQNALIVVLAQIGSFVPARSAHIGIVDRLFSRVGAADDLARGRSTFMVEMVETAAILNQATDRSLVILDEIGRGTATFDGLSIAWATVEFLHDKTRARVLFATHYHELTALSEKLAGVANVTMQVKEWRDDIIFLHKVAAGAADRSYGIQVARLAGLPAPVISRAGEVLAVLESSGATHSPQKLLDDLPLFSMAPKPAAAKPEQAPPLALTELQQLNPDDMSPRQALEALYKLKGLLLDGKA